MGTTLMNSKLEISLLYFECILDDLVQCSRSLTFLSTKYGDHITTLSLVLLSCENSYTETLVSCCSLAQPQASSILLNSTTLKQILQVSIHSTCCFLAFSASSFLNVVELSFSPLDSSETRSTTSICSRSMILRPIFWTKVSK